MTDATYIHADFHEIMKQYKICSPKNMLKLQTLLLAHRIIYDADNLPCFLRDKYSCKKEIGLRNKLDFVTPYYRTNFGQRSINFCLAKEWNCLPPQLKNQQNFKLFKKQIKIWLLGRESYDL